MPSSECLNTNADLFEKDLSLFIIHYEQKQFEEFQQKEQLQKFLIVADTNNHCIRLLDIAQKTVKTLIGTGNPSKYSFSGLEIILI